MWEAYLGNLTRPAGGWSMTSQDDMLSLPPKVAKYFRNKTKVLSVYNQSAQRTTALALCISMPSSFFSAHCLWIPRLYWRMFPTASSNVG